MELSSRQDGRSQDFFRISAPGAAVDRAIGGARRAAGNSRAIVLDVHRRPTAARGMRFGRQDVPVIPFPMAAQGLVALALDSADYRAPPDDLVSVYLPRAAFDQVADRYGTKRIASLSLKTGAASGDTVMWHLGACLNHALEPLVPANPVMIDQLVIALNSHVAHRYGGLQPLGRFSSGGLSPWQLRLVLGTVDRRLADSLVLEDLARGCGLSVSHFSRAFAHSMGLAPHRWIMQRRIEVAKEMLLARANPLSQIALACGFSDQSHFTRAFAVATGSTPGRWQATQLGEGADGYQSSGVASAKDVCCA